MQGTTPSSMPMQSYYPTRPRKSRWWIPVLIIGIIVIVILFLIFGIIGFFDSFFAEKPVEVKPNSVLYLNYGQTVMDYPQGKPFSFMQGAGASSFYDIVAAIRKAKNDPNIQGIYFRSSNAVMGLAKITEIIDAIEYFKQSGKFVYSYMDYGSKSDYLQSLPADKIFMPREGIVEMNNFGTTAMFYKGLLDKIGISFHVEQFEDFKSAGEMFNRTKFSDSARLEIRELLQNRLSTFTDYVSKIRKIPAEKIKEALDEGAYTADKMKEYGFIDDYATEAVIKDMIKEKVYGQGTPNLDSKKLNLISPDDYLRGKNSYREPKADTQNQIAIVYASGVIEVSRSDNPFSNGQNITPKAFIKNLQKAREDKSVKAIILRIDSPGGSVLALDDIWDEIQKTKKVKPIYASMSDVAASGGYYMAIACDTIIAQPTTITGSIGVISVIPNFSGLMNKLDITIDTISTGPSSQDLNLLVPFNNQQLAKMRVFSDSVYGRFVQRVANSRHKTFDETRALAKGRVWSGDQAFKLGLVDELGGLQATIEIVKKRLGIAENITPKIKFFPKPVNSIQALLKLFNLDDDDEDAQQETTGMASAAKIFGNMSYPELAAMKSLPDPVKRQLSMIYDLLAITEHEQVLMAMPVMYEIK